MGGRMARQSFKHLTDPDQISHIGIFFSQLRQPRLLSEGAVETDIQYVGHHFGNRIHFAQGDVQGPAHIADHRPGFKLSEGDDLGHKIAAAIFINHVFVNIFAAINAKIHVDIRHAFASRIEETLKNQAVGDGIKVGDAQAVSHETAGGRPSAGSDRYAKLLGVQYKIRNNQEIA